MPESTDSQSLDELLNEPLSDAAGRRLICWARSLRGRIQRGDMALGILLPQDVQRSPVALNRAIACGVNEAWLDLASWFTTPPIGLPNYKQAEHALRSAIEAEVPGARLQFVELRWFYQRDDASVGQRIEAIHVLHELLKENEKDTRALHLLGLLTCQGFGVSADPQAAYQLQKRAAALGYSDAQFELYVHYAQGIGVPRDDHAAFEALTLAANAGHPRGLYNMGVFHAIGQHVPKDLKLAAEWYEKAFDAGDLRAAITLAVMYATGEGVERDMEYAKQLLGQAEWLGCDVSAAREAAGIPQ